MNSQNRSESADKPKQGHPYSDLVQMATTLIYKDVSHVSLKQEAIIKLLKLATAELIAPNAENGLNDATSLKSELKIDLKIGDASVNQNTGRTATLLDLYAEHAAEYGFNKSFIAENEEPITDSVQEVLDGLVDSENKDHIYLIKSNPLSGAIEGFLRALLKASGIVADNIKDLIESAKKITPQT